MVSPILYDINYLSDSREVTKPQYYEWTQQPVVCSVSISIVVTVGCSESVMTLICLSTVSTDYPASRHNVSPPHLVMSHFSFMCKWESLCSFTTRGKQNEIIIKFLPGQFISYSWAICLFWWLKTSKTWLDQHNVISLMARGRGGGGR